MPLKLASVSRIDTGAMREHRSTAFRKTQRLLFKNCGRSRLSVHVSDDSGEGEARGVGQGGLDSRLDLFRSVWAAEGGEGGTQPPSSPVDSLVVALLALEGHQREHAHEARNGSH